jgi:hypothetical protein
MMPIRRQHQTIIVVLEGGAVQVVPACTGSRLGATVAVI